MSFSIHILGTSSATPTKYRNPSAQVLNVRERLFLIDCGEGTQRQIINAKIGFKRRMKIFITHMHGDHLFGLPGLLQTMSLMDRRDTLKIYGPKGVGALYVKKGVKLQQITFGGAHERNKRPGTENIPGIIGLAKAVEICENSMAEDEKRIGNLRDLLFQKLTKKIPHVYLNGHPDQGLAGLLNLSFQSIEGEALLLSLDLKGVAGSSGSACTSGSVDPSHVLSAMGVKPELAQSSIRFSLGRGNTIEDVEYTAEILPEIVDRLRQMSPL